MPAESRELEVVLPRFERVHAIRAGSPASVDVDGVNLLKTEFDWAAAKVDQFDLTDAPTDVVFDTRHPIS